MKKTVKRKLLLASPMVAVSAAATTALVCTVVNNNVNNHAMDVQNGDVVRSSMSAKLAQGSINAADIDSTLSQQTNISVKNSIDQYSSKIASLIKTNIERNAISVEVNTSNVLTINNKIYLHYTYITADNKTYGNDVEITGFMNAPSDNSYGSYSLKGGSISLNFNELPKDSIPFENLSEFNNLSGGEKLDIIANILRQNVSLFIKTNGNVNQSYQAIGSSLFAGGDGGLGLSYFIDEKTKTLEFSIVLNVEEGSSVAKVVISNVTGVFLPLNSSNSTGMIVGSVLCILGALLSLGGALYVLFFRKNNNAEAGQQQFQDMQNTQNFGGMQGLPNNNQLPPRIPNGNNWN